MIRRLSIAVCALLGAAALTSCAQFERNDVAASVNGNELSQEEMAGMLGSDLGASLMGSSASTDTVAGETARSFLSIWIRLTRWTNELDIPAETTALVENQASQQFGDDWTAAPQALRDLVIADGEIGVMLQDELVTQEELLVLLEDADVFVDSRYGAWDAADVSVVALG